MEKLTVGSIVLVRFPFSNLQGNKLRPAFILAQVEFNNLVLCQITSRPYSSTSAIAIDKADFASGSLPVLSFVRPDKLFTADHSIITKKLGELKVKKKLAILSTVRELFVV